MQFGEKKVELAFEHDRFFDMVRTGQAAAAQLMENLCCW
jgi:hypothetical protein